MAERYESVAIPFVKVGNRRGLTYEQIMEHDYLNDFVRRFPNSFEQEPMSCVLLFIEPTTEGDGG